jgi:hypothetical protein
MPCDKRKNAHCACWTRWNLRLTSLVNSKIANAQAAGFSLALETCHQSQSIFLSHSKAWYNAALAILAVRSMAEAQYCHAYAEFAGSQRKGITSSTLLMHATDFLLLCFGQAARLAEYAREVANPAGVRKLGDALLQIAGNESADIPVRILDLSRLLVEEELSLAIIAGANTRSGSFDAVDTYFSITTSPHSASNAGAFRPPHLPVGFRLESVYSKTSCIKAFGKRIHHGWKSSNRTELATDCGKSARKCTVVLRSACFDIHRRYASIKSRLHVAAC